tara:strand:+ start:880 stop:1245 length:366 start_codon:yes stop_codon:yes gene_type:complete
MNKNILKKSNNEKNKHITKDTKSSKEKNTKEIFISAKTKKELNKQLFDTDNLYTTLENEQKKKISENIKQKNIPTTLLTQQTELYRKKNLKNLQKIYGGHPNHVNFNLYDKVPKSKKYYNI